MAVRAVIPRRDRSAEWRTLGESNELVELRKGDIVLYDARIRHRAVPFGHEGANAVFVVSPSVW